ncbi:MAG: ATP-dependent RecD-like DNA helicase [Lachnospiraceae bacterium]|nr:ATP-dependent RecD-like DNA helicase [Lachnospiraceae bacterium]
MEELRGYIEHIIFRNTENGYTVLNLVSGEDEITCVGFFKYADEGENVKLTGEYIEHTIYGEQFKAESCEITAPEDTLSIIRYLGSGAVKGVGQALAARIVREFGEDTFRVIEEEPERLVKIKGISDRKAREIALQVIEKQDLRKIMVFLQQYGISGSLANKIYQRYGNDAYRVINENPYILADDINGIGFKIADEIASKVGIHTDSDFRIRSALIYLLSSASGEGHCYLPREELINRATELLDVPENAIETQISNLYMEQRLVVKKKQDMELVYGKTFYYMELNCARRLKDIDITTDEDEALIYKKIKAIENIEKIELEELQREAVVKAAGNGLTIITGGPGTGKTTIINTIIRYFEAEQMDIVLAAPTGRAAKRMTEATGCEASTIQRMLRLKPMGETEGIPGNSGFGYEFNEDNPIEADVVIIDEMSMVDIVLFNALLRAIPVGVRLILVGDINQLPSVGPGAVLKDIITSRCFNVYELKKIFRQDEQSDIVLNAHRINEGRYPVLDNKSEDFFFLERDNIDLILNNMIHLIREKLPRYVNADPYDIQVLTPMRKGNLGVEVLNPIIQRYLNPRDPSKKEYEAHDVIFREGDKVMQIKNNYRLEWEIVSKYGIPVDKGLGVFNGDMGIIKEIDTFNENIVVEFDGGRRVTYPFSGIDELEHAYAVTIHKSQGSEYPAVVIPILTGPRLLFNRNLLYTGVTRAKDCVVLLGSRERINSMVDNTDEHLRYTGLDFWLRELYREESDGII